MISELLNADRKKLSSALVIFTGTVSLGTLIIYQFKPEVFMQVDTGKLIILAFGVAVPFLVPGFMANAQMEAERKTEGLPADKTEKSPFGDVLTPAALFSAIIVYPILYAAHFFHLDFFEFALATFSAQIGIVVQGHLERKKRYKIIKDKSKKSSENHTDLNEEAS